MNGTISPTDTKAEVVVSYRFKFPDTDWCEITVNNTTGHLSVNGSEGSWGTWWNPGSNLGVNGPPYRLTDALAENFSVDYVVGKLVGRSDEYDPDATERGFRDHVLKERRSGAITRDEALVRRGGLRCQRSRGRETSRGSMGSTPGTR